MSRRHLQNLRPQYLKPQYLKLKKKRKEIEKIDKKLVQLLLKRVSTVAKIKKHKIRYKMALHDPLREKLLLNLAKNQIKNEKNKSPVISAYQSIIKLSRDYVLKNR